MASLTFIAWDKTARRFTDPRSDLVVSRDVSDAVEWLQGVISRSLWTGSGFSLSVPRSGAEAENKIQVVWNGSHKREEWRSERVAFKSAAGGDVNNSPFHIYSPAFQTFTPAVTIRVHHSGGKKDDADWVISVSGYGFVRAYRKT
jgi:hypothetical protein